VRFLSEFANEVVGLPVKKGTGKRPERKMQNVHTNIYTLDIFSMQEREENMNIKGQKEDEESESIVHI